MRVGSVRRWGDGMRSLLAAVAALLVLAVPIAVRAKPVKVSIHQLTPAPGSRWSCRTA